MGVNHSLIFSNKTMKIKFIACKIQYQSLIPPQEQISHKDVLDAIISACQKDYTIKQADGTIKTELGLDHEALWWKTHKVSSVTFGRFAEVYKKFEKKADQCFQHMTSERATQMSSQIMLICEPFKTMVNAKSSESRLDKSNRQQTLIDTLSHNKSERVVTLKDDAQRSIKEAIVGKEKENVVE